MMHGGFSNIEDFNIITPDLSKNFRLIGIDSRGHGKSNIGKKLSYKILADDLEQIINTLNLKEFNILGFSDGGTIAYRYAIKKHIRLKKIVTMGSSWELNEQDPSWDLLSQMIGAIWKEMFPESFESYLNLNPSPDFDYFSENVINMWNDLSLDGYPNNLISHINNEMLVIRGDNDILTSLNSMSKLRGIVKNMSFLNIPFAEHAVFLDSTEIVLHCIEKKINIQLQLK